MILFAKSGKIEFGVWHIAVGQANNILARDLTYFICTYNRGKQIVVRTVEGVEHIIHRKKMVLIQPVVGSECGRPVIVVCTRVLI